MKTLLLTLTTIIYIVFNSAAQDASIADPKEGFIKTWRVCHALDIEETADTLSFQKSTPDCLEDNCGEHQWSFRSNGTIEFVFTKGCNSGFNSVSTSPKRWVFVKNDNILKFISNDGFIDVYAVQELTENTLVLIRRRDLE